MSQDLYFEILIKGQDRREAALYLTGWLNDEMGPVETQRGVSQILLRPSGRREVGDTFHARLAQLAEKLTRQLNIDVDIAFDGDEVYSLFYGKNAEQRDSEHHYHEILPHLKHLLPSERQLLIDILREMSTNATDTL